jgi:hypothetical protein
MLSKLFKKKAICKKKIKVKKEEERTNNKIK